MRKPKWTKGKTTQELLNLSPEQFVKLNRSELSQLVSAIGSTANKRLKSLQKSDYYSSAAEAANRSGGKFTTTGKNINQLRAEYLREKAFLESESSTVSGARMVEKKAIERLQAKTGITVTHEDFKRLWQAYDKIVAQSPEVASKAMKYLVLGEIQRQLSDGIDVDKIFSNINENLSKIYEEHERSDAKSVSGFFEFE